MSWNYRIVVKNKGTADETYGVHEVYYNANDEITMLSEEPIAAKGLNSIELMSDFNMQKLAFNRPILDWAEIEFADIPWDTSDGLEYVDNEE